MDDLSERRNPPRQVYVPVHRRKELEEKKNTTITPPSKYSEKKADENVLVKKKGRGQFRAPTFDSHQTNLTNQDNTTKLETKQNESSITNEDKAIEKNREESSDRSLDEITSKMQDLRLSLKEKEDNDKYNKQKAPESKPSSRDRNTPGRDPRRPATTDMVAKRLIHGALGIKMVRTPEQRQEDKDLLRKAKEQRQAEKDSLNKK